ncbi:hypothetical protein [Nakamurella deserti]|nr:hypothetical protein [Nakamurella deserti]
MNVREGVSVGRLKRVDHVMWVTPLFAAGSLIAVALTGATRA